MALTFKPPSFFVSSNFAEICIELSLFQPTFIEDATRRLARTANPAMNPAWRVDDDRKRG